MFLDRELVTLPPVPATLVITAVASLENSASGKPRRPMCGMSANRELIPPLAHPAHSST
jgi:hypothetical protein